MLEPRSRIACSSLLALILLGVLPLAARSSQGHSAWDRMVAADPAVADSPSYGPLERRILRSVTPQQAARLADGDPPATIELADGSTVADLIGRWVAGLPGAELTYQSLETCRLVATTSAALGKMAANEERTFLARGPATDLSSQGGSATGCGVPSTAEALVVNLRIALPDGGGVLKAWPADGGSTPGFLIRYDTTGDGIQFSNAATLDLCDGALCAAGDFVASTRLAGAHLFIDVLGYFAPSQAGDISAVTAGAGLLGGGSTGDVTLDVSFAGGGAAATVARSDHGHPPAGSATTDANMQPFLGLNYIIALVGVFPTANQPLGISPFIGEIRLFAGNFAPAGWAFCNGQLLAISSNPSLFAILGTIYGGDGTTTFALPDLRGRSPLGAGSGPGLTSRVLGQRSGAENSLLSHSHDVP